MSDTMRAVTLDGHGGVEVMRISEVARPVPKPTEVLVRVRAAALNRADTIQRSGEYSAPPGESEILGVELAGEVDSWGSEVSGFQRGDKVFGLVGSGAYAEYCSIDAQMAIRMPEGWSYAEAVATPEVYFTADTTLFELGELQAGESILIHAAGSGVGSAAIQMARHAGARVFCTVGSEEKARRCVEFGAEAAINYRTHDFAEEIRRLTGGAGVDVIEDFVGVSYYERNISILKNGGRLILVGILDERLTDRAPLDMLDCIMRRIQIKGSSMRPRPLSDKQAISRKFERVWLPLLVEGKVKPVLDSVFPLEEVARAHERMEANLNFGKIVLTLD
ncbi:MAG TPA: NAD(P)H-quinone oxidoreductase [Thermoanaerobaculia bacterium]|nr:NAD(P)H-quinone oxidoreductase [Thermoanaerobaculia bacterium]